MYWKDALIDQITDSKDSEFEITVTELAMTVSKLINIVRAQGKRLVISNRGEKIAILIPYSPFEEVRPTNNPVETIESLFWR